ncbi:MAG TPA: PKD domain-containing protein, partial [Solirubrobacter sp.]
SYSSDPDGEIVRYELDLDGDGSYETDLGESSSTTRSFATLGTHEVGVRVTDDDGATGTAIRSIRVQNANDPPTAEFSGSASGLYVYGNDADGGIRQIAWDLDGDDVYEDRVRVYDPVYTSASDQTNPIIAPGSHEIGVRVTDTSGAVTTRRRTVTVRDTGLRSPYVSVGYQNVQPRVGESLYFGTDPTPGITYAWDLDDDGEFDDAAGASTSRSFSTPGPKEIRVRASDALGNFKVGRAVANISPAIGNRVPALSLSARASSPVNANVSLYGYVQAAADAPITGYSWDLDADGAFDDGTANPINISFATVGPHTVSVRVSDTAGGVSIQRSVIDVYEGNRAPTVLLQRNDGPSEDRATVNQAIPMLAYDQGLGDPIVRYAWDTDEDGQFDDYSDTSATTHTLQFATPGTHRVRVLASAASGATDIATMSFVVSVATQQANREPRPQISGATSAGVGRSITLYGYAPDPDGDAVGYAWDLDDDGAFDDSTSPTVSTAFATPGTHRVRLRASDIRGGAATATWSISVREGNGAPAISYFYSPTTPRVGRPATLYASASDPDGDPVTYTYDLDGDGAFDDVPVLDQNFNSAWVPASTQPLTLAVRATDPSGLTATATLDVKPVDDNLPPVGMIIAPSAPLVAGRAATFNADGQDPDGAYNSVTYAWDTDNDGAYDDGAGGSVTLTPAAGQLRLGLRITDADGATFEAAQTVVVGGAPPEASFTLSTTRPTEGDTVTLTSTATASGAAITSQQWDLDDDGAFDDATGASVQHTFATGGATRVGLKVRDAGGETGITYRGVTVLSLTAPSAAMVWVPTTPALGQLVSFVSVSTDPQGAGDIASLAWDLDNDGAFDDGAAQVATTTFTEPGPHRVRLRVRDRDGHEAIADRTVTVSATTQPTAPPDNDAFGNAQTIGVDTPELYGNTTQATAEAGEPKHAGQTASHSVWFRYDAPTTKRLTFGTCGSAFDTVLAVYRGASLNALSSVTADDSSGCGDGASAVTFDTVAGETYWLALDGVAGASGAFRISLHGTSTAAPPGDLRSQALTISTDGDISTTNLRASKEPGEPNHAGNAGGHSIWFALTAPKAGPVSLDVCGAAFDTLLAVYTDNGGLQPVAENNDSPTCGPASGLEFTATAGVTYYVAVDGRDGATGEFTLRTRFVPVNDAFAAPVALADSAAGSTYLATPEAGEPAHGGTPAARSVWYTLTTTATATRVLSTCTRSTAPTRIAVYEGTALVALTPVSSSGPTLGCAGGRGARVTWRPPNANAHTYRIAVDTTTASPADFVLDSGAGPFNDDRVLAPPVIEDIGGVSGTTVNASHDAGEPDHAGAGGVASVWYQWTPSRSAPASVATCDGPRSDTILAVYRGAALDPVVSADDTAGCGDGRQSRVVFDAVAGTTYWIAVDARAGATGDFAISTRLRPTNDDRANARVVTYEYDSAYVDLATKEPAEPNHAGAAGGHSVWYRWTPVATGAVTI